MHVVIWCGPVTETNLKSARLPAGAKLVVFNKGIGSDPSKPNVGSSHFGALGAQVGGSIRTLLAQKGVNLDQATTVTLSGFSAAHGLIEKLLSGPDAARVTAVHGADAYYTGASLAVKPGYRKFFERAAAGEVLAILTTSANAGPGYPSASAATEKLVAGLQLAPVTLKPPLPDAERAFMKGGAVWADYGMRFKHGQHATVLAPLYFTHVITPYLEKRSLPAGVSGGGDDAFGALVALGLIFGFS